MPYRYIDNRPGKRKYNAEHARQFREMRKSGMTYKQITEETGANKSSIIQTLEQFEEYGYNPQHPMYSHAN